MHGENMREKLNTEITRKQFLQYAAAAALMVFGVDNIISLLTGHHAQKNIFVTNQNVGGQHGFGSSRFGV